MLSPELRAKERRLQEIYDAAFCQYSVLSHAEQLLPVSDRIQASKATRKTFGDWQNASAALAAFRKANPG